MLESENVFFMHTFLGYNLKKNNEKIFPKGEHNVCYQIEQRDWFKSKEVNLEQVQIRKAVLPRLLKSIPTRCFR